MFYDIDQQMEAASLDTQEPQFMVTTDLLYADDTMLASSDTNKVQLLLGTVITEGSFYGLELNWDKTVALRIKHNGVVFAPSGSP
eukprot:743732-Pyramimonas_sp.AAC.1